MPLDPDLTSDSTTKQLRSSTRVSFNSGHSFSSFGSNAYADIEERMDTISICLHTPLILLRIWVCLMCPFVPSTSYRALYRLLDASLFPPTGSPPRHYPLVCLQDGELRLRKAIVRVFLGTKDVILVRSIISLVPRHATGHFTQLSALNAPTACGVLRTRGKCPNLGSPARFSLLKFAVSTAKIFKK